MTKWGRRFSVLVAFLGFGLIVLGGGKLTQPERMQDLLFSLGVPAWGIPFIGWGEIFIGMLLAHGPTQRMGAWALTAWMTAAAGTHFASGDVAGAMLPVLLLGIGVAGTVGWRRTPIEWDRLIPTPLWYVPQSFGAGVLRLVQLVGPVFLFRWAIGGVLFWMCLPVLGWAHARRAGEGSGSRLLHFLLLYLLVLGLGAGGFWNFVGHFVMSDMVAESIGWATGSPFQHELAFYHLGTGVAGLLCLWWRDRFWIAAGLPVSIFVYGAGVIHVREFLSEGNTNPGNWSVATIGGNFVIPTVILVLLFVYARRGGFSTPEALSPGSTGP